MPNGAQRLARLRELCLVFEQIAADDGLDYDSVSARMREWVGRPIQLDPPHPVGAEAVEVMTVHQAKGLEFPVVAIWDGKGQWNTRPESGAWRMEHVGCGWMLDLDGLTWEEPAGLGIRQTERAYLDWKRRRVVYVAARRARDLLIVPKAGDVAPGRFVCGDLLAGAPERLTRTVEEYVDGAEAAWARDVGPPVRHALDDAADMEQQVADRWATASREAARPRFQPASVTNQAHVPSAAETEDKVEPTTPKQREGRYGGLFGSAVHHAIGIVLRDSGITAQAAVLRAAGLARAPGEDLQLEYPIAGACDGDLLVSGYIDLVAAGDGAVDVIDFKTDAPPQGPVEQAYPKYAAQVRAYGRLLAGAGVLTGRRLRCGLLFTADGIIRWVEP